MRKETKVYVGLFRKGECLMRIGAAITIKSDEELMFVNAFVGWIDGSIQDKLIEGDYIAFDYCK